MKQWQIVLIGAGIIFGPPAIIGLVMGLVVDWVAGAVAGIVSLVIVLAVAWRFVRKNVWDMNARALGQAASKTKNDERGNNV